MFQKVVRGGVQVLAVAAVFSAVPAEAIDKCKIKVDRTTGVILVTAVGAAGPVAWGGTDGAETEAFFNAASCVVGTTAKKCQLADPATLASKTPPAGCTIYLDDGTAPCSAWVPGCTPGPREAGGGACGDGHAEGAEACDGQDLAGRTCESEGYPYGGTLACSACAIDASGCHANRFEDNGDGTVIDWQTRLQWEKKTGDPAGAYSVCPGGPTCGDLHDVNNAYTLSDNSPYDDDDGGAFTLFLAELNGHVDFWTGAGFAGHDDWRLPTRMELLGIVDYSAPYPSAKIDPVFGPTKANTYWTTGAVTGQPSKAWYVSFFDGIDGTYARYVVPYVRAVRSID